MSGTAQGSARGAMELCVVVFSSLPLLFLFLLLFLFVCVVVVCVCVCVCRRSFGVFAGLWCSSEGVTPCAEYSGAFRRKVP